MAINYLDLMVMEVITSQLLKEAERNYLWKLKEVFIFYIIIFLSIFQIIIFHLENYKFAENYAERYMGVENHKTIEEIMEEEDAYE